MKKTINNNKVTFPLYLVLVILVLSKGISQSQIAFEFSDSALSYDGTKQLSVAFHSLSFIDSEGHTISELIFGTNEANNVQDGEWFENLVSNTVGECQWAGGTTKQASVFLDIPQNADGFLLKIRSIMDSLWMEVKIENEIAANLRVDAYWHSGYVPIGEATPEDVPIDEPEWVDGYYFPHLPPTDRIYVFPTPTDLEEIIATLPSWRINQFYREMMTLTLVGMQGIINRHKPSVYLDFENNLSDASRFWIPYLKEHVEIVDLDLDYLSAVQFLFRRYGSHFTGSVIYDPEVPETINLATMIAGLENRMILAPEQLDFPGIPEFSSTTDLRLLVQAEGWDQSGDSKVSIYQWVYDNLWPDLEHRIIGVISPGPPMSGEFEPAEYNPFGVAQREYLIALKLSALYLDGGDSLQAEIYSKFLADAPSPSPVTGVSPYETTSVPLISQYGHWNACLSYPNDPVTGNFSVLSGVRPNPKPYHSQIDGERILATLGTSPVAMMFCSDGDNLSFQINRGFAGGPEWVWEKVQGTRYGWSMNPTLINLAPVIWNYYVDTRDQVEFVCGLSGAGFTLPDYMNTLHLENYIKNTSSYLDQTGFRTVIVYLEKINVWTDEMASIYYNGLHDSGYLGAISGKIVNYGLNLSYAGSPAPASAFSYKLEANEIDEIVEHITNRSSDHFIFDFGSYPDHRGTVVMDSDATDGQAALFSGTSSDYAEVMAGPFINLAPGDYTATFRFKSSNNLSSQDFIGISIGRMKYKGTKVENDGWEEFAQQIISPDDFSGADIYQLIQIPFTLDRLKTDIEVVMRHRSNAAQFTADYFSIQKNEPLQFPVFTALTIPLLSADRMTDVPQQFASKFLNAGGILLTPDEFMAALNPEYMIEFAIPYLGAGYPALTQANQELADGKYFTSLLTVRNALKTVVSVETPSKLPEHFELSQNYPNPFNPITNIKFVIPSDEYVTIDIFNIQGQHFERLIDEMKIAGTHKISFQPQNLVSGVYLIRMIAGDFQKTQKIIFLK